MMPNKPTTLREEFERSFNSKHGSGFHALANDGKRSSNCEICAEDRRLNPKGYYLTFLSEKKHYWTREMMNDVADWWLEKLTSHNTELISKIEGKILELGREYASKKDTALDEYTASVKIGVLADLLNFINQEK